MTTENTAEDNSERLDGERTRNYAARLVSMVEDGDVSIEAFAAVLREHAAGPPTFDDEVSS